MATDITLKTSVGDMLVAEFAPTAEAKTAVIVVHEAFGLNSHIRQVAENFSKEGHLVLAPDFFHLSENSVVGYDDLEAALTLMSSLVDDNILEDVDVCTSYLGEKGIAPEAVGIVGFCMGGRIAYLASVNRKLGAGVTFYGGGIVTENITGAPPITDQAKNLKTPWLGLFGDLDSMIPTEGVESLRVALEDTDTANEIVRYPDADHGFHCNEREESYNPEASKDAWGRTIKWFDKYLK